jgi:hypothetical protein
MAQHKSTLELGMGDVVYSKSMTSPRFRVDRIEETRPHRVDERAFYVHGVIVDTGEPHTLWCTERAQFYPAD